MIYTFEVPTITVELSTEWGEGVARGEAKDIARKMLDKSIKLVQQPNDKGVNKK
jgi:hypothetical protein